MKGLLRAAGFTAVAALAAVGWASAEPAFQWSDLYDGGALYTDYGTACLADPEGDLIVGGECTDGVAGSDMLIRRLSRATGATEWTRRTSAFDGNDMALSGMVWDPAGNILVGGHIRGCDT